MTARRVQVIKEHIIQTDDINELKCGERCQFLTESVVTHRWWCKLEGQMVGLVDRNRTEACTDGDIRAMGETR